MELGLKGKTALVTGASEGIGMAIARTLAEEGVRIAICARTEAKLKQAAAKSAQATGMEVVSIPADLRTLAFGALSSRRPTDWAASTSWSTTPGLRPSGRSSICRTTPSSMRSMASSWATFVARRPSSRTCGGVAVAPSYNITGTTQQAIPLHTPGSACNAAIRMFSKELSMELGPLNIRVNSLAPGRIQTARSDRLVEATAAAQGARRRPS